MNEPAAQGADQGADALARYLRQACEAAEAQNHKAIMVTVPKPFALPLWEAREIASRLEGSSGLRATVRERDLRIAELEKALVTALKEWQHDPMDHDFEGEEKRCTECQSKKRVTALLTKAAAGAPEREGTT